MMSRLQSIDTYNNEQFNICLFLFFYHKPLTATASVQLFMNVFRYFIFHFVFTFKILQISWIMQISFMFLIFYSFLSRVVAILKFYHCC